jgi:thiopeptide-type bacteriocin biosynthesis protein
LQANVRVRRIRGDGLPNARVLFAKLGAELPAWRRSGDVLGFYYMRKPPGLRLRFQLGRPRGERRIVSLLDALRAERTVQSWVRATYEPEVFMLGGPEMLPLVHAYFDADSAACMAVYQLRDNAVTPAVLSLAVLGDLFERVLEGPEEVWDVWCNLAALHGMEPAAGEATTPPLDLAALAPLVSARERPILRRYASANRILARGMHRLAARGELRYGLRSILPFIAVFHWNRYALSLEQRTRIFSAMTRALDPRQGMRGR